MNEEALKMMMEGNRDERKFLSSESFGLFAVYYFSHYFSYALADFHYEMIDDLETLVNEDEIRELAFIMFRESAKTTLSKIFLIWLIAQNKYKYINVDSSDKENSERILFDIAYELSNNHRFIEDYGVLFSRKKGIEEVKQTKINNFITENGIRVEAHSTQESVRGRLHLNQRPDFMLMDDFETNKTKDSVAYTKQIRDHISEAMGGMSPNGRILYLGNYITEFGNIQYLLDRAKKDKRIRIHNVPVMDENEIPLWGAKYARTDEEAKLTGKVSIEDKERQLGSYVFSYEMMNKPVDDKLAEFKKNRIQFVTESDVKQMETLAFITIDSAVSEKESADYTGIVINRVTEDNKWYVTSYRLKCNSKELIDHIFYLQETYNPKTIGLEETSFSLAIKPFLEEEMRKRMKYFSITPLKHRSTQKETRIRAIIPRWESGSIFLVGDNMELLDEMRSFPRGVHDDVLDSLAYQVQIAHRPHGLYHKDWQEPLPKQPDTKNPAL